MSAAVAAGTPSPAEGAAPADLSSGEPTAEAEGATEQGDTSPERSDLNSLLERRKPPAPKAKAKGPKSPAEEDTDPGEEQDGDEDTDPGDEHEDAAPDAKEITADKLFTDEALKTPEGVKRARALVLVAKQELERRHRRFDRADIKLKAREQRTAAIETRGKQQEAIGRAFYAELQTITGMRESDPLGIFRSLDKVAGGNGSPERGRELFEACSLAYAREGKLPQKTRGEQELERRLDAEKAQRDRERQEWQEHQLATQETTLRQQVEFGERNLGATANTAAFPGISGAIARGTTTQAAVGKWLGDLMQDAAAQGEPLDMQSAIGILESRLGPPARRAPQGETAAASPIRPRQGAQRRAAPTVLPASADLSSGRGRPLTHEENLDELARDPEFMGQLFGRQARA